ATTGRRIADGGPHAGVGVPAASRQITIAAIVSSAASATIRDSLPPKPASGPAASAPTKLPAIAAAVQIGKRRLAWRASNVDVATVHARVTPIVPAATTGHHVRGL